VRVGGETDSALEAEERWEWDGREKGERNPKGKTRHAWAFFLRETGEQNRRDLKRSSSLNAINKGGIRGNRIMKSSRSGEIGLPYLMVQEDNSQEIDPAKILSYLKTRKRGDLGMELRGMTGGSSESGETAGSGSKDVRIAFVWY